VRFYDGVDGLKTGYTTDAGYCLTATAKKGNMRVIAVVMGEPDSKTRNQEVTEMLDYAFAQYGVEKLLSTDSSLGNLEVIKGKQKFAEIIPTEDVTALYKKVEGKKNFTYEIKADKIKSPVKVGDKVGELLIKENNSIIRKINLTVKKDVKRANLFELYFRYIKEIITGDINF